MVYYHILNVLLCVLVCDNVTWCHYGGFVVISVILLTQQSKTGCLLY